MNLRHLLPALGLAGAAFATQAQGWCGTVACAPLPDAVGTVETSNTSGKLPVLPPGGGYDGTNGGGSIDYAPLPLLEGYSVIGPGVGGATSNVRTTDLVYFFRIESLLPGALPVQVPLLFQGRWSAFGAASGGAQADAELRVALSDTAFEPFSASFSTAACGQPCRGDGSYSRTVALWTGALYSAHLFVVTDAMPGYATGAAAQVAATLDPSITVDPRFAANWFVAASAGVGTAAPVPEPAPALLFAAGAAALFSRWRVLRAPRPGWR